MAYILVVPPGKAPNPEMVARVDAARVAFPDVFLKATWGLVTMDTSEPLAIVELPASEAASDAAIARAYYARRPDDVDFLTAYTEEATSVETMHHMLVRQDLEGIGLGPFDQGAAYGSQGRLLGLNYMKQVAVAYSRDDFFTLSANGVLHETGHQWCCYVGQNFAGSADKAGLRIIQQGIHWYRGLHNPNLGSSPMGSDHWIPNGDGTFHRYQPVGLSSLTPYHPFTLYLMGVLPGEQYDFRHPVYDAGVGAAFDPTSATFFGYASVRDIIAAEGPWRRR